MKHEEPTYTKRKSRRGIIVAFIILTIAVVGVSAFFLFKDRIGKPKKLAGEGKSELRFVESGVKVAYDEESKSTFYTYKDGKGFFHVTKDGIRYRDIDGIEQMNYTFSMASPVVMGEGNIVAVTDRNGNEINVYNNEKLLYSKKLENLIVHFSVNKLGYTSVITKKKDSYGLVVYTAEGAVIGDGDFADKNMYPIATDVSNDGRILAISILDVTGAKMTSQISFSYLNKSESLEFTEGVFGSSERKTEQIISLLKFMDQNTLLAFSDKEIFCYEADNKCNEKWHIELDNELVNVATQESGWFAVAYGKGLVNRNSKPENLVEWYDLEINLLGQHQMREPVHELTALGQLLVVGTQREFYAINKNGNVAWRYDATYDSEQLLLVEGSQKFLLVGTNRAEIYKVTKEQEREDGTVVEEEPSEEAENLSETPKPTEITEALPTSTGEEAPTEPEQTEPNEEGQE